MEKNDWLLGTTAGQATSGAAYRHLKEKHFK